MAERFYLNLPLSPGLVELTGPEAHHLAVVSRLRPGDPLCLFNGDGHEYPARLIESCKRSVTVEIVDRQSPRREATWEVELASPIPKGDRAHFLIEKLTELGVTRFVPIQCERSIVHPREGKFEKYDRYVIEASKQCGRNRLMEIGPLESWPEYCRRGKPGEMRLLAHPQVEIGARTWPFLEAPVRLAVGPEGGFTAAEIDCARAAGWGMISFGPRIFRLETAALALAALVLIAPPR